MLSLALAVFGDGLCLWDGFAEVGLGKDSLTETSHVLGARCDGLSISGLSRTGQLQGGPKCRAPMMESPRTKKTAS